MTKNFLLEPFADGVQIDEIDFVKRCQILYSDTEFSESFRWKFRTSGNGDINVGMGVRHTFRPRTEPNDLNIRAQHASSKCGDISSDLSRSGEKLFRNHRLSVSVLVMMSTGFTGASEETGCDVWKKWDGQ